MKPKSAKTKYALCLSLVLSLYALPSLALGKRDIAINTAEDGVYLSLSRGYGVVINLSTMGQTVSTAWLSDPSQITLASNKGACTGDACNGSSVLYLKPIDRLSFPGLPSASDSGSLLSIITNQGSVLQFKLSVTSSTPSYTSVALIPERQRIIPPAPKPLVPLQQASIPAPVPQPEIVVKLPPTEQDDIKILQILSQRKQSRSEPKSTPVIPAKVIKQKIEIKDDEPKPEVKPTGSQSNLVTVLESKPTPKSTVERSNQELAGALLRGINSQRGKREVGGSIHSSKAQDVMWLLKKDADLSLADAIKRAGMDPDVARNLINYGTK